MKRILFLCFFLCVGFLSAQDWMSNYDEAVAKAEKENKPILLVFSGSDWCGPCIKMDAKIWKSTEFITYSKENLILYKADFPQKKANQLSKEIKLTNGKLAEKYNRSGFFPLVIILDSKQKLLGKTAYKKLSPKKYIAHLSTFVE